jgi:hypothetical protein
MVDGKGDEVGYIEKESSNKGIERTETGREHLSS